MQNRNVFANLRVKKVGYNFANVLKSNPSQIYRRYEAAQSVSVHRYAMEVETFKEKYT